MIAGPTDLLFQLEPSLLLDAFVRFPPVDFSAWFLPEGGCAFAAEYDLLTTLEPDLLQRLHPWVERFGLKRWVTHRTVFVGATVSEYAVIPAVEPQSWLKTLVAQYSPEHWLVVIKDLPLRSPLLSAAENAHADALIAAGRRHGWLEVEGMALAFVPIRADWSEEDFLASCSKARRKDFRRKLRARSGLQIRTLYAGDSCFQSDALIQSWYELYLAVYEQSQFHFDRLSLGFLTFLLREPTGAIIFCYEQDGVLLGWNLCFVHEGRLIDKYIGLAYPQAREAHLYFVSWFHNMNWAHAHGLHTYVAGWTDPEVKATLGASFTMTRHLVYIRPRLLRMILNRLRFLFEYDHVLAERLEKTPRGVNMKALVLDLDGSVLPLPAERRIALQDWQECLRFSCRMSDLDALGDLLAEHCQGPEPVFMGSGDFHHLGIPLIRARRSMGMDVVVLDNHPDNMRFPWGVHCGSWVAHVAAMPEVHAVHVVGIHAADVRLGHFWEQVWGPLYQAKVHYWTVQVPVGYARWVGLSRVIHGFDTIESLLEALDQHLDAQRPVYLSVDKDVLDVGDVRTNWDQGVMRQHELFEVLDALRSRLIGVDVTGEVSVYRYQNAWKRRLSALDGQQAHQPANTEELQKWQQAQQRFNQSFLARLQPEADSLHKPGR